MVAFLSMLLQRTLGQLGQGGVPLHRTAPMLGSHNEPISTIFVNGTPNKTLEAFPETFKILNTHGAGI